MTTNMATIRESLDRVHKPSIAAIDAYESALGELCLQVGRATGDDAEVRRLIGDNPLRVMLDCQRTHAHLVSTMMRTGAYPRLIATTEWTYRAYTSQGFDPAYFPAEFAGWRAALSDRLPEHAAEIAPLYEWMEAHHEDWQALSRRRPSSPLDGPEPWSTVRREFFDALRSGDAVIAQRIADEHVADGESFLTFAEEVIRPALTEVGLRWELGELRPIHEHRATSIAHRVVSGLGMRLEAAPRTRGHAIVGCAPHESHELGGYLLATMLELDGWSVSYVGADVPAEDFAELVRSESPEVVWLSVAMPFNVPSAAAAIEAVRAQGGAPRIVAGGAAFLHVVDPAAAGSPDAVLTDLRSARELARNWSGA